ncbi:Hypothetical predicted protein [Paramuricea clavata]|uniref:Uncharacterized protein n=1 Tax=Paramuricea clavata TaxID=317549 RepID=A0A7D9IK30_PARCT|nr:Hypothetical predicted protein [Paramuricea clavata]
MENEMEREQDYDMANEGDVEFCEPEIVVENVEFETPSDSIDYVLYNLVVSVVDTESDEDDAEFVEAISENESKILFPCSQYTNICKSKREASLTKHTNSQHRDAVHFIPSSTTKSAEQEETRLSKENLASIVIDIKTKLIKEELFGPDINSALKKVSSSKNKSFLMTNQDKMLEDFYGLLLICKFFNL